MSARIVVVKAGIATTVQDLGRAGYRATGVPHSGALDPLSLKLANLIAGNPPGLGALEMLYSGVVLEARGGSLRCALAGAEAAIETAANPPRPLEAYTSCLLRAGERLRVGGIRHSAAAYLAIEGGLAIEPVLGSVSTYPRGELGGWHGRALRSKDELPLIKPSAAPRPERRLRLAQPLAAPRVVRVMTGPHEARFTRESIETFLSAEYVVASASDRSGLRLEGPALRHAGGHDVLSEGIAPGSIQVPGSGLPVVLIADHPTVGGYPKIATIISADLAAAGRLRIGSRVRFAPADANEAARARADAEEQWRAFVSCIETI